MSRQQKNHTKGAWLVTPAGRPYRYIDIEGVRYCQWDNERGQVSEVPSTTSAVPRSIPEVTASSTYSPQGHQSGYFTLFPRESARQSPSLPSATTVANQQPTNPILGHRDDAISNPLDRLANVDQTSMAQGRHANETHLHNASGRQSSRPNQPSNNDQHNYPPGTKEVTTRGDRTYFLGRDGKVISVAPARQQEARTRHGLDTTVELTVRLASMGTEGRSSEESGKHTSSRNPSDHSASAHATAEDLRFSSRHGSYPRNSSQSGDRDPQVLSARPGMARHSSRGSVIVPQDENSHSQERSVVPKNMNDADDDHELSAESGQVPRKHSVPQQSAYKEANSQARGQVQRVASDEAPAQRPTIAYNARRISMNQGSGLPTIGESELLKATKIAGDNKGHSEVMDDRYYVRKDASRFFTPGRVFAMLWHENAGNEGTDLSEGRFYKGKYGQNIYSTIRRMVVVKEKHGHCTCVPIATYGGQGTLKAGLSDTDIKAHSVIYMLGTSSAAAPGEKIVKNPIAVKPAKADQKLHPMSRINFDKIYTIEHNVKVMNVGKVVDESMHNLSLYFFNTHFGL